MVDFPTNTNQSSISNLNTQNNSTKLDFITNKLLDPNAKTIETTIGDIQEISNEGLIDNKRAKELAELILRAKREILQGKPEAYPIKFPNNKETPEEFIARLRKESRSQFREFFNNQIKKADEPLSIDLIGRYYEKFRQQPGSQNLFPLDRNDFKEMWPTALDFTNPDDFIAKLRKESRSQFREFFDNQMKNCGPLDISYLEMYYEKFRQQPGSENLFPLDRNDFKEMWPEARDFEIIRQPHPLPDIGHDDKEGITDFLESKIPQDPNPKKINKKTKRPSQFIRSSALKKPERILKDFGLNMNKKRR
jgi:hypothetical protein